MRIQIIETDKKYYDPTYFNSFKKICDVWVSEYGAEKLDWLHAATIDYSCDVFINPISAIEVQIGFVLDESKTLSATPPIHWVNLKVLDTTMLDGLTQSLLVTIGMNCIQSVAGNFCVDWADVRTVLSHGTMAYCVVLDWNTPEQGIGQFRIATSQLKQPVEVVGCVMLLNQGLRISHTYENVQSLTSANIIPADCLTITNMTNSKHIPQTNMLMFVCKNRSDASCLIH